METDPFNMEEEAQKMERFYQHALTRADLERDDNLKTNTMSQSRTSRLANDMNWSIEKHVIKRKTTPLISVIVLLLITNALALHECSSLSDQVKKEKLEKIQILQDARAVKQELIQEEARKMVNEKMKGIKSNYHPL